MPAEQASCRYLSEWTATKLRWGLSADDAELAALTEHAEASPDATVTFEKAG
ncbi:hypothetical protein [Streptomyces synnematoformans]|uniref:Uncharacterized protein n=1 Tax=Streptomyces synnematoformans TaxID=415721 RepID=A0ABP5J9S0_9ACTN